MNYLIERARRLLKLRFAILYPLGLYLALFCSSDDHSMLPGSLLMMLGMFIRVWSNGYAIKMGKLTTSGPYALVRNPLYLGTALILLGVIVLLKIYLLGVAVFVVMGWVYSNTIRHEQKILTDKFGQAYLDYLRNVPVLFPSLKLYLKGEKWPFSWKRVWESREYKVIIWMVIVVIAFHLKEEILIEKELPDAHMIPLFVVVGILGSIDLLIEFIKNTTKKKSA